MSSSPSSRGQVRAQSVVGTRGPGMLEVSCRYPWESWEMCPAMAGAWGHLPQVGDKWGAEHRGTPALWRPEAPGNS